MPGDEGQLRDEADLLAVFTRRFRPEARLVGMESERIGLFPDGAPLRYADSPTRPGVARLFAEMEARQGWAPQAEKPGGPPLMLVRGKQSITLEPGSQFELSGAPHASAHAVYDELLQHRDEMAALSETMGGLTLLGVGFHPFARQDDLDWVPKSRYPIMRAYLPTRGAYGLDMMRRTATVQANFDFASERDALRKLRAGLALSPLVSALFANSPVVEGVRTGEASHRATVWLDMDNDRAGLLPFAWSPDVSLGDYVRWALDVPMFIVKRDAEVFPATHLTFRRFMAEGLAGHRATVSDWESHLKTLFPEVRLAHTLEVRGADSVPAPYATSLAALWLGALYDDQCLDFVQGRLAPFGFDAWQAVRPAIARHGLAAPFAGATLADLAREVLAEVRAALGRRNLRDAAGNTEAVHLDRLDVLVDRGQSVGQYLLDGWDAAAPDAAADFTRRMRF